MLSQTARLLVAAFVLTSTRGDTVAPISAESLRADVAYLASDKLEGRLAPSQGLDLAAEYIAAQFKAAHLQPAAAGYFQPAIFQQATENMEGFRLALKSGNHLINVAREQVRVRSLTGLDFSGVPVLA